MRKALFLIGLLFVGLSACKEDSLLENNPVPPSDNIELNFLPYYGEDPLKLDSMYTNAVGSEFIIDSVSMLVADFSFHDRNLEETIDSARNYVELSTSRPSVVTGRMPAQGYYGNFSIILGQDSISTIFERNEVLAVNPNWIRNDRYGVNFFKIKGRVVDPFAGINDPQMVPISYTLGTYMLADTSNSDIRGFSVDNVQSMRIFLLTDLKPLLEFLPMIQVDRIKSDPTDNQDFSIAKAMADSLHIGIF